MVRTRLTGAVLGALAVLLVPDGASASSGPVDGGPNAAFVEWVTGLLSVVILFASVVAVVALVVERSIRFLQGLTADTPPGYRFPPRQFAGALAASTAAVWWGVSLYRDVALLRWTGVLGVLAVVAYLAWPGVSRLREAV